MREKKMINVEIGGQIKLARERMKLTQEQFAERIEVSPQYVSDLERGVVGIAIPTLKRVCTVLGVASDQILFGTRSENRSNTLAEICNGLSEEQFRILVEISRKYVEAVSISSLDKT